MQLDAALNAERLQRADEDRTGALLNLIKAAKEVQGMEIDQLEKAINMINNIENNEVASQKNPQVKEVGANR